MRKYTKTERFKIYSARARKRYTFQRKARWVISNSIKAGIIPPAKNLKCGICGKEAKHYHHHHGYSQEHWFDVIALCIECHTSVH
jgi:hypothetical protein